LDKSYFFAQNFVAFSSVYTFLSMCAIFSCVVNQAIGVREGGRGSTAPTRLEVIQANLKHIQQIWKYSSKPEDEEFLGRTQYAFGNILFWTFGQILPAPPQTVLLSYGHAIRSSNRKGAKPNYFYSRCGSASLNPWGRTVYPLWWPNLT